MIVIVEAAPNAQRIRRRNWFGVDRRVRLITGILSLGARLDVTGSVGGLGIFLIRLIYDPLSISSAEAVKPLDRMFSINAVPASLISPAPMVMTRSPGRAIHFRS